MVKYQVAVLGAGVIGLSSAVYIQETHPDCHVTIISENFSPNTTSDGSGGFWYPNALGDTDPILIRNCGMATYSHLKQLAMSSEAGPCGIQMVTGYFFDQTDKTAVDPVLDMVDGARRLTSEELQPYPGYITGMTFTTPIVHVTKYLEWLMKCFQTKGGHVERRKINSMTELVGQWDAVVNCCGMGAMTLLNDLDMFPVRGQVIRVEAPWIKHYYAFHPKEGFLSYILPGGKTTVVGGTNQVGDWNEQVDELTETSIWERAVRCLPQLTHAKKISSWAGLRPCRSKLRLETEIIGEQPTPLRIVHNYGHGGAGVTLHWGCAKKAAALLSDLLPSGNSIDVNPKSLFKHKL